MNPATGTFSSNKLIGIHDGTVGYLYGGMGVLPDGNILATYLDNAED